jgi:hypothetical protein
MKSAVYFRIAAILFLLFAAGHTFGFLTFRPPTAEGQQVWAAMNRVKFSVGKETFSYGEFYVGFGLAITSADLFAAWLTWTLGSLSRTAKPATTTIAWSLVAWQITWLGLMLRYFSAGPAILSFLTAVFLALAARSVQSVPLRNGQSSMEEVSM